MYVCTYADRLVGECVCVCVCVLFFNIKPAHGVWGMETFTDLDVHVARLHFKT